MSLLTALATGAVGVAVIVGLYFILGDAEATLDFLASNWGTLILGIQIVAAYILAAAGRRLAGGVLTGTAILTLIGQVIAIG